MATVGWYAVAALGEIAGCFAFWAWLRLGKSAWLRHRPRRRGDHPLGTAHGLSVRD